MRRYESESRNVGRVLRLLENRVANSSVYRELESLVRRYTVTSWLSCTSVAEFKAAGGRSKMFEAAVERACSEVEGVNTKLGGKLYSLTPKNVLKWRLHSLESECLVEEFRQRETAQNSQQ